MTDQEFFNAQGASIGAAIKEKMTQKKIGVNKMNQLTGVNKFTLDKIFQGNQNYEVYSLLKVLKALNMELII